MHRSNYFLAIFLFSAIISFAQDNSTPADPTQKKSVIDKVNKFSNDLIAQPDQSPDTFANKFVQDNLTLTIPAIWKDKGSVLMNDIKLPKADEDPFVTTLPFPKKKLIKGMVLTLNTIHKSPQDKKQLVLSQVKAHLADFYKQAGKPATSKELDDQLKVMVTGPETFTTNQGVQGELYFIHDIQSQQANYIVLYMVPGAKPNTVQFVEFQYYKYIYETTPPDDILEWRTFLYPDDQQAYVDFSKKIIKTLIIR